VTDKTYSALTPAGVAYREVAGWMIGKEVQSVAVDSINTWIVQVQDAAGDGAAAYVVWNPDTSATAPISFTVPKDWAVSTEKDLSGKSAALTAGKSVRISSSPILLD
jgi:hypothetical protein